MINKTKNKHLTLDDRIEIQERLLQSPVKVPIISM